MLKIKQKESDLLVYIRGRPFDSEEGGGAGTFGRDRLFIFIMGSTRKFISR